MITSLILLKFSLYTPWGLYCEIYPLLEGNTEELNFNIPLLRIIYCICIVTRGGIYCEI